MKKKKQNRPKIELDWDTADAITICTLKQCIETIHEIGDDAVRDNEIIAAIRKVLEYFGKP